MNKTTTALATTAVAALLLAGCGTGPVPGTAPDTPAQTGRNGGDHDGAGHGKGNGIGKGRGHGGGKGSDGAARNVILMVGDGMGAAARDLIRLGTVGLSGELEMDSLPVAGRAHTNSADPETFVTDSAAAATSMATGVKTYNGAIGMDRDRRPVPTALEVAEELGKATGLVTTSLVTDATPAAFGSHVLDRDEQSEIARQFLESSRPEVILGGGEDYWYPAGDPGAFPDNPAEDPSEESQGSAGNLVERAGELGYDYVSDAEQLAAADGGRLLGLFANQEMFQYGDEVEESYDPAVPLADMAAKALDVLSAAENGFFLLVEEEGIDAMAHVNDAALTLAAGAEFDRTVGLVREFAQDDGETLVIVVGDHETGGLTIESLDDPDNPDEGGDGPSAEDGPLDVANSDQQFLVDWTTGGHSAVDVPLTAMGPGSEELDGVYENTRIFEAMVAAMRAGADGGGDDGSGSPGVGQRQRFDLQAHRGGRGEYTEESLTAFARSLELGVSTLELDTHLTEDGRVVVWHDDTIQPEKCRDTAPAQPADPEYPYVGDRVADLTLAQVKTLDCGYRQLPGYPEQQVVEGNRIAELRDVYALAEEYGARKVRFNVETKVEEGQAGGPGMTALTEAVVAEVRAAGAGRRTTIQSFDWSALNLVQQIAPELRTVALAGDAASLGVGQPGAAPELGGIDIDDFGGSVVRAAAARGYDVVSPTFTTVDAAMLADARRLGLPVIPYTVNEAADMERLIELGVSGLITDYPTRLRSVMEERGLRLPKPYPAPSDS